MVLINMKIRVCVFFMIIFLGTDVSKVISDDRDTMEIKNFVEIILSKKNRRAENSELIENAKLNLMRPEHTKKLSAYSDELTGGLSDYQTSEKSCILLGLLPLPENITEALLQSDVTPDKVRARLGDKQAEEIIVSKFKKTSRLDGKRKYAADLLYIGTDNTLTTFAKALESDEYFINYQGTEISLTQIMIQSYGQVNTDVKLFSPAEYGRHCYISKAEFAKEEHQKYLRAVEKYFSDNYNIEIHITTPFLIHGKQKVYEYLKKTEK